jgi:hypothetical protein
MGNIRNSLRSNNGYFLSIFGNAQIATSPAEFKVKTAIEFAVVARVQPALRNGRLAARVAPVYMPDKVASL